MAIVSHKRGVNASCGDNDQSVGFFSRGFGLARNSCSEYNAIDAAVSKSLKICTPIGILFCKKSACTLAVPNMPDFSKLMLGMMLWKCRTWPLQSSSDSSSNCRKKIFSISCAAMPTKKVCRQAHYFDWCFFAWCAGMKKYYPLG